MEAKDLRIGNYVTGAKGAKYNGDTVKWNIGDYIECNKYCDYIDSFKPIPITEEYLFKFGFEVYAESTIMKAYKIGFNTITRDYLFDLTWLKRIDKGMEKYPFYRNGRFKIKYVHQLQNLYFALTGEELETNEN